MDVEKDRLKSRVLFCFSQTGSQSNGGVLSMLKIAQSLESFAPVFLTQIRTKRTTELINSGFTVIHLERYNWKNPLFRPVAILLWNLAVMLIIKRQRISIVHANDNQMVWRIIMAVKLLRVKWLVNIRDVFDHGRSYGWSRIWVNFSNKIVVLSNEMKKELQNRLPFSESQRRAESFIGKISVVYSIVEDHTSVNSLETLRKRYGFSDAFDAHVLYVAAFNAKKNQLNFIQQALPKLKELNVCVHFLGDFDPQVNPYARNCAQLVQISDLTSHVKFHGFQEDISSFYMLSDLTLVPTRHEGLARCMIESLKCGTPVISFDVCSASEILVARDCGVVVKQGDYNRFCNEIETLLRNPPELKRLSVNAKLGAESLFDKGKIIRQYEKIYREL